MKKSILFVINTMSKAGAEVALLELLRRIPKDRYEVSLFVLLSQGELITEVPGEVQLYNRTYETASVLSDAGRKHLKKRVLETAFSHASGLRNLSYVVRNHKAPKKNLLWRILSDGAERFPKRFDLAVAFLEGGSTYYVADHVDAVKKACVLHVDYGRAGYSPALDLTAYEAFDRIFAVSEEVRQSFLKAYPEKEDRTGILSNIIDQDRIRAMAMQGEGLLDDFDGVRLLTVGRLTAQKGYDVAIRAMKQLKERSVPVRWYVLGDGEERERLSELIRSFGLEEDFLLLGAVDNPYPYMRTCDIVVHATRFEGKSIAIQEALTLGKPVIASDCSGNREQIVHDVDGVLCDFTETAVADAVERLAADQALRDRLAAAAAKKPAPGEEELQKLLELTGV